MITTAIQKGEFVYAYDERNSTLFSRQGVLLGYTSGTVTIKRGGFVTTYNEKGNSISTVASR